MYRPGIVVAIMLAFWLDATVSWAYGPRGHALVGAIADKRLTNTVTAQRVSALLDHMSLQRAATIADEIKSWDRAARMNRPDKMRPLNDVSPRINGMLRDFVLANSGKSSPFHHDFHFTDVPVVGHEQYASAAIGTSFR